MSFLCIFEDNLQELHEDVRKEVSNLASCIYEENLWKHLSWKSLRLISMEHKTKCDAHIPSLVTMWLRYLRLLFNYLALQKVRYGTTFEDQEILDHGFQKKLQDVGLSIDNIRYTKEEDLQESLRANIIENFDKV